MGIQINGQTDTISAVDGSITVATDLTVPGVLTYEDVTNVDSIGIITARTGLNVTGGNVKIGTTTAGNGNADNLTLADSGNCGITIRSGTSSEGAIYFSDATSGAAEYDGYIAYNHSSRYMVLATAQTEKLRITSAGKIGVNETDPAADLVVKQSGNTFTTQSQTVALFQRSSTAGHGAKIAIVAGTGGSSDINFGDTADEDIGIIQYFHTDNSLRFTTNTSEKLRITSAGVINCGHGAEVNLHGSTTTGINLNGNNNSGQIIANASNNRALIIGRQGSYGQVIEFFQGTNANEAAITIPAADSFGIETAGTERVRVDSSGRMGIGENSPGSYSSGANNLVITAASGSNSGITLNSDSGGTDSGAIFFAHGSGANAVGRIRYYHSDDHMDFYTANAERLRITSDGNIGMGIANPTQESGRGLHIRGASGGQTRIHLTNSATGDTATDGFYIISQGAESGGAAGEVMLQQKENAALKFATNNVERLRINSGGKMALGTDNPGSYDNEANDFVVAGSDHTGITIASTGSNQRCNLYFSDGTSGTEKYRGAFTYDHGNDYMEMRTAGAKRLRVTNHGRLDVFGSSSTDAMFISSGFSAGTAAQFIKGMHSASSIGSGTASILIHTNGNVQNTNGTYGQISDVKLKENIVDANSQWDDIKSIQIRNFNFKEETGNPTHTQIGVIAQEIELVSPELVYDTPDTDADGNDLGTVTKAVSTSVLYMKAVKALQEAQTRIETLETQLTDALARITALEGS